MLKSPTKHSANVLLYLSFPSEIQLTSRLLIILANKFLASIPQKITFLLVIQVCFNSGVSMQLNLIFSPSIWIVSPSIILISEDLALLIFNKNKKIKARLETKKRFFLFKYIV